MYVASWRGRAVAHLATILPATLPPASIPANLPGAIMLRHLVLAS